MRKRKRKRRREGGRRERREDGKEVAFDVCPRHQKRRKFSLGSPSDEISGVRSSWMIIQRNQTKGLWLASHTPAEQVRFPKAPVTGGGGVTSAASPIAHWF